MAKVHSLLKKSLSDLSLDRNGIAISAKHGLNAAKAGL